MADYLNDLEYFSSIHQCFALGKIVGIEGEDSYLIRNNSDGIEEACPSKYIRKITKTSSSPLSEGTCEYIQSENQFLEVTIKEQKGLFYLLDLEKEDGSIQTLLARQKQLRYIEFSEIDDYIEENFTNIIFEIPPELSSWVNSERFQDVVNNFYEEEEETENKNSFKYFMACFPEEAPTILRILCKKDDKELFKVMLSAAIDNEKKLSSVYQDKENNKKELEEAQKKNKVFYVNSKYVGIIIGSQGANIKGLKAKYNVSINVESKKVNEKGEAKIIITGEDGDNVESCYKEINLTQKIYEIPQGTEYDLKKRSSKIMEEYKLKNFYISFDDIEEEGKKYKGPNVTIIGPIEYIEDVYKNEIKKLSSNTGGSNEGYNGYEGRSSYRGNKNRGYGGGYGYNNDGYKHGGYYSNRSYGGGNYYYKNK